MTRDDIMTSRRLAGAVKRYHTWPVINHQSVAEHSWRVAMIYMELFAEHYDKTVDMLANILCHILEHDMSELHTGDLPFPVKSEYPELRDVLKMPEHNAAIALNLNDWDLDDEMKLTVKLCDLLEMFEYGLMERAMGNRFADPIIVATRWKASTVAERLGVVELVRAWCVKEDNRYA